MKLLQLVKHSLLAALLALAGAGHALAATVHLNVTLDTSALVGLGPFSVAFQLVDGSGTGNGNNTVTLSGFNFGGGSAGAGPDLFGGASGSLTGNVNLIDSDPFFNAFVQAFTAGSTLSFQAVFSNVADGSAFDDMFAFSLLDALGMGIPTLDPNLNDTLLSVTMLGGESLLVQASGSDTTRTPFAIGAPLAVPEPSSMLLVAGALLALVGARRRPGPAATLRSPQLSHC